MLSMLFLLPTFLMRGTISNWLQRRQDNGTKTVYGDGLFLMLYLVICLRMRHKELAEKYGLTPVSCRMTLMRIRRRIVDKV